MAMRSTPWIIDTNTHPAQDARLAMAAQLGCNITASFAGGVPASAGLVVDPGHGVCGAGDFKVAQNGTPNMSVLVAAGQAMIRGTLSALQGVYTPTNDASVNMSIAAANATNPRRDLVIVQIRDNAFDAGGVNDARLLVVTGTPAASPADPSLASYPNALVLARVAVAANATSITNANITDLRSIAAPWANGRGEVGVQTLSSSHGPILNTTTDITFGGTPLSVTWSNPGNRKYRTSLALRLGGPGSGSNAVAELFIRDAANNVQNKATEIIGVGGITNGTVIARSIPAAGSVTHKASLVDIANQGVTAYGAVGQAMLIMVEDIGGALT